MYMKIERYAAWHVNDVIDQIQIIHYQIQIEFDVYVDLKFTLNYSVKLNNL